jgi:tRNA (guanine37-N1)-methyltransferase
MLQFDIITIFPRIFDSYLRETFIKKAQEKDLIKIQIHNLREFTADKHKTVDDRPYGGGLGMVLKIEPIYKAVQFLKSKIKNQKSKIILFTPRGKEIQSEDGLSIF